MKKNFLLYRIVCLLGFAGCLFLASCKKQQTEPAFPPELTAVTDLANRDIPLSSVQYGDWIIIKGKHLATTYKVDFNTVLASDSLIYANDTSVTVKIPAILPAPADNPVTVTTKYGSATLNFKILQPPPVINAFDPMAGNTGDMVTISGNYFLGVSSVKFDAVDATIVSTTKEEIKVKVPAGISYAYISVTTPSGTVKTDKAYGFRYLVFDDALVSGWSNTSFSATTLVNNTTPVKRGTMSVKTNFTTTFGALRLTKAAPAVNITGYSALKFSIYGTTASLGKKIKIYFNGVSASGYTIVLNKAGEWLDFQIPLSNIGSPTTLTSITMQEFSGILQEIYVDDIGLL